MAAAVQHGTIVAIAAVPNFDQLPPPNAQGILENTLVPACEIKGVSLSEYGNHNGQGSLKTVAEYNQAKQGHTLFDVARVQKAFASLDGIVQNTAKFSVGSYGLKHVVEEQQKEYITNGDLIAAMMLKGYRARFGKKNEQMAVNCEFKAKVIVQIQ